MRTDHHVVSFDETSIGYSKWGQPTKNMAVVFCSGIACDDIYWSYLAPELARDRLVLTWDYPFHGRSGPS
ncbi:MAG: alpha/beta hydrolase, partial [Actinomycetota bacterium]